MIDLFLNNEKYKKPALFRRLIFALVLILTPAPFRRRRRVRRR